jgi:hypothetical protein
MFLLHCNVHHLFKNILNPLNFWNNLEIVIDILCSFLIAMYVHLLKAKMSLDSWRNFAFLDLKFEICSNVSCSFWIHCIEISNWNGTWNSGSWDVEFGWLGRGMPIIFFSSVCRSLTSKQPAVAGGGVGRWGQRGLLLQRRELRRKNEEEGRSSFNRRASSRVLGFARSVAYTRRKLAAC